MAVTITQEITLDTVKYNTFKLVAKQYDTSSRFLKVTVQQNGVTLDVSDATTATINVRRPDDATATFKGEVNSDGTVTVPLPNYALVLDGIVKCSVGVLGSDTELKTLNFSVEVQQAESDGDSEITEDENYSVLLQLIEQVENLSGVYLATYDTTASPTVNSSYTSSDLNYQDMSATVGAEFVCLWHSSDNVDYFCTCYISAVGDDTFTFVVTAYAKLTGEQGEKGDTGNDGADGADGSDGADGRGISSIAKSSTSGLVDTYTITYTDGTKSTFTITNGADGSDGADGSGTTVIANPDLSGDEEELTSISINGTTYKIATSSSSSGDSGGSSSDTYDSVLNNNTWAQISAASSAGVASSLWSVGDTKAVTLSGTIGTLTVNETLFAFILGFNHNSSLEGNNIIHFGTFMSEQENGTDTCLVDSYYYSSSTGGTKYFNINHWGYRNYGGWAACDLRYDVLGSTDVAPSVYGAVKTSGCTGYDASSTCATSPVSGTFMAALPSELRAVMKPITKYTDNVGGGTGNVESNVTGIKDYLPLLSEYEVSGDNANGYGNSYEYNYQAQYDYYANGNETIKYCHGDSEDYEGQAAWWWLRSPYYDGSFNFCIVYELGRDAYDLANYSNGVAPLFGV